MNALDDLPFKQKLATEDFYYFTRYMFKARRKFKWQQAQHHPILCNELMKVYRGETNRLILTIPPRYSKTEIAVVNFMAWGLGVAPDAEFIHCCYSGKLATNSSYAARSIVTSPEYQELFPGTVLMDDSSAKDEWRTTEGGIVYAVGTGGTITGYGAGKMRPGFGGAIIIDDPHKADEAKSDTIRPQVIDWFQNTLESRKNSKHTPIILIMQRLHEEDLAGWLINGGNGEEWKHVNIPAIQPDGSALWPEKHTIEDLRRLEQTAPWTFSAQYMQNPVPIGGGIFKPDLIEIIHQLPKLRSIVRGWDLAATQDDGDWTAGAAIGQTYDNPPRHVIIDMRHLQGRPEVVERALVSTAKMDGGLVTVSIPQDPGQAGKSQVNYLTRALSGFKVVASPESGDKVTRAEPFAAQVNVGAVMMMHGEWNASLLHEMRNFPYGAHDDQVDAMSRAFNTLNEGSTYDSSMAWVGTL